MYVTFKHFHRARSIMVIDLCLKPTIFGEQNRNWKLRTVTSRKSEKQEGDTEMNGTFVMVEI